MHAANAPSALHVAAVAVLIIRDGRVLAMRRAATKDAGAGLWEAVSGRLTPDEDPLDGARREVAEETGLQVRIEPRPWTAYAARRNREPMLLVTYRAAWISGEVRISDEHDAFAWLDADAFARASRIAPLVRAVRSALAASPPRSTDARSHEPGAANASPRSL
ncbi:MAG: NUDIX domain-containing protein [Trueperaceae bacterium]